MHTHIQTLLSPKVLRLISFGALCMVGSFVTGIQSAGEVHPFQTSQAISIEEAAYGTPGDVDGSGSIDLQDVIRILEVTQGYTSVTALQLKADPNGDNRLTVEDALRLLRTLAIR